MAAALIFAAEPGCELEQAHLAFIPPSTVRVIETQQCVGVTCWSRYLVIEGQRRRESRVCEFDGHGRPLQAPGTGAGP